jgi:hypothetical protein
MPVGGLKCPDCGHRFKPRKDELKEESTEKERAFLCPGGGGKGRHEPRIYKFMRINAGTTAELVKVKIIQVRTAEYLDEFQDAWEQANRAKYRPDLIFR